MILEGAAFAGASQLVTMFGDEAEYMGRRSFLARRARGGIRLAKRHPFATAAITAPLLLGRNPEYMGRRSFFTRQASRASKVVRPLAHQALNVVDKIPVYNVAAKAFRSVTKTSAPGSTPDAPGTPGAGFQMTKGMKIGLGVGAAVVVAGLVAVAVHHN